MESWKFAERISRRWKNTFIEQFIEAVDSYSIHVRPPEIEDRVMPGHWEGDFIKGADNRSSVGVLVERPSRLMLLARMEDATAASVLAGFSVKPDSIAAPMRHSFTYDQGKDMSRHQQLALNTGVRVYFCEPHSPWRRATCENTNGLLRQYLPKSSNSGTTLAWTAST